MATSPLCPPPRHLPPRGDTPGVPPGVPWRCHPGYPWCPQMPPSPGTPLPLEMSPQLSPVSPAGATPGCPLPGDAPPIPLRCPPRVPPIPSSAPSIPASPPHGFWHRVPRPVVVAVGEGVTHSTPPSPPQPPPHCTQGTMPVGGGLLCAASGLALLVTATATDFWLQHRAPGGTVAIGLWHLCLGGHCRPPPGPPGRRQLWGRARGSPICARCPQRARPRSFLGRHAGADAAGGAGRCHRLRPGALGRCRRCCPEGASPSCRCHPAAGRYVGTGGGHGEGASGLSGHCCGEVRGALLP